VEHEGQPARLMRTTDSGAAQVEVLGFLEIEMTFLKHFVGCTKNPGFFSCHIVY